MPLPEMTLKAAENGHAEIVRFCLERGAKPDYDVINQASEFPEVYKVLVTVGGLDVNQDWETAGDMLINAAWELKVRSTSRIQEKERKKEKREIKEVASRERTIKRRTPVLISHDIPA